MPAGMGSGFIWDDKGHVVTNYHVIKDAAEVQVTLVDQSVWPAKVRLRLPDPNPAKPALVRDAACASSWQLSATLNADRYMTTATCV